MTEERASETGEQPTTEAQHLSAREDRLNAHDGPRVRPRIGKVRRGEPTSRCADPPTPALRLGIEQFNRGEFFEQHETLEAAWIAEEDPLRYLYQGILQVGVGFHHLTARRNARGARNLWTRGIALLQSFRGGCMDVDVARLIAETERCLAELARVQDDTAAFNRTLIPRVHWLGGD